MGLAIGIDLGTTNTVAAVVQDGRAVVIPNAEGQHLTPSVVAVGGDGNPVVGSRAKAMAACNPHDAVFSIKRRMGSDYRARLGARQLTPEEVSSLVLSKVKADAEVYLGQQLEKAVITVPAYFNDPQRQATREAGRLAGLEVMRIINEPTAAALAYGLDREDMHTVLVWDLGGGTFDVSILELGEGVFEVRAVSGDTWLGGDDFDQRLAELLALEYRSQYGAAVPLDDRVAWQRLREGAERAKIELSTASEARVGLCLGRAAAGSGRLVASITRGQLEEATSDLVQRLLAPTRQALADAGLVPEDLDRVILVGGATRMPAVRAAAREWLGKEPYRYIDPDEVVAVGAAIQAGVLTGTVKRVALLDVIPLSLGLETQGGLFARIIPRNTPLPASESRVFTTARDNQASVSIHVLQGEREQAFYNISLGEFQLEGIPPLPRGVVKIEVGFDVDVDGIVHVSAADLEGGNEVEVRVVSSKALHPEEMQHMIGEAASHAEEDSMFREEVQATFAGGDAGSSPRT